MDPKTLHLGGGKRELRPEASGDTDEAKVRAAAAAPASQVLTDTFLFRLDFTASRRNLRKMFGINLPINAYISKARVMS